jgi:hypothetical protein
MVFLFRDEFQLWRAAVKMTQGARAPIPTFTLQQSKKKVGKEKSDPIFRP